MSKHYEFIVIGSGAGGGTVAHELAMAGREVLMLERGDFLPAEAQNWNPAAVFGQGRYVSQETWTDSGGKPFQPQSHYFVGGATKLYGAALFRLRPEDFNVMQHIDGASPQWPVTYADMETWYTRAEQMYHVHGRHGTDPTEGSWSGQYPHPPVTHSARIQAISDGLQLAGYRPFPAPSAVLLDEDTAREPSAQFPCVKCSTCDGHPCMVHAKADAEVIGVQPLLELPNFTLKAGAEVVRLINDKITRRVYGVQARFAKNPVGQQEYIFTADTVILAAGAVNSAKILLASGIGNSSDQVGRNYMCHNSRAVLMVGAEPNTTVFQKTLSLNDFYLGRDSGGWPLGNIQMVGKSTAAAMRGESKLAELVPGWTLSQVARHAVDWWLTTEDLPLPESRVTLDPGGNVRLAYTRTNDREAEMLYRELRIMMRHLGARAHHVFTSKPMGLSAVAHQAGTCRMGDDPYSSVVDGNLRSWDVPNLYVVDASVFPSVGAVNPALTVMALALRAGSHLLAK